MGITTPNAQENWRAQRARVVGLILRWHLPSSVIHPPLTFRLMECQLGDSELSCSNEDRVVGKQVTIAPMMIGHQISTRQSILSNQPALINVRTVEIKQTDQLPCLMAVGQSRCRCPTVSGSTQRNNCPVRMSEIRYESETFSGRESVWKYYPRQTVEETTVLGCPPGVCTVCSN